MDKPETTKKKTITYKETLEGKQFSKRKHNTAYDQDGKEMGTFVRLHTLDYFGVSTDEFIKISRQVLKDANIDVDGILKEWPHGSGVRDHVLNYLNKKPDSIEGLAAIVLEKALHVKAYQSMNPVHAPTLASYAYELARYGTLLEVYIPHIGQRKKTARVLRPKHPVRAALKDAFKKQRRQGGTLQEALTAMAGDNDNPRVNDGQNPLEYLVTLECPDGEQHERIYKIKTLENLWAESQI